MKHILFSTIILLSLSCAAQGVWTQMANFGGPARASAVAFSIGNKGYLGLGRAPVGQGQFSDFWEYDPATDTWTQKSNFPGGARLTAVGFSIGNKGYVGTGAGMSQFNDFWEYDPATDTWTQKTSFGGTPRNCAVGFSVGNKGYIGTGENYPNQYKDFWEYDPATNAWTQKADVPGPTRSIATGFSIGNKGYLGTGKTGFGSPDTALSDFWEYDPSLDTWTQKANFGGGTRSETFGFVIGNHGYVGIGTTQIGFGCVSDFWRYNASTNSWSPVASFANGLRECAAGFVIDCKAYVGTGWINDNDLDKDMWKFTLDTCGEITGIRGNTGSSDLSVSPNPFSVKTRLSVGKNNIGSTVLIYDFTGQVAASFLVADDFIDIPRGNLKSGIYTIQVKHNSRIILTQKLVVTDL